MSEPTSDRMLADTFYARRAHLYDRLAVAPVVRGWREHASELLDAASGDTVVDMGCGTGANAPALRERVGPNGRVVGIDLVPEMLERARARVERGGWENVSVIRGDATRPPVRDVDALLSTFVVGMFTDPGRAVRTWIQRVRPGGRVVLMNFTRPERLLFAPLNLGFRLFVRASAAAGRLRVRSLTRELERKWTAAKAALFEGTVDHETAQCAGGYVELVSGRVPQ